METKFTKGEWLIEECPSQLESTITSTNGKRICVVKSYPGRLFNDPDANERIANAKLIAAAPDLLEACIMSRNAIASLANEGSEPATNCLNAIESAIKKATE